MAMRVLVTDGMDAGAVAKLRGDGYEVVEQYQYVTGITAACALSEAILTEGEAARGRYLTFLESGSSAWALEILRKAGVDLADTAPFERAMALFKRRLDEGEALWK